MRVELSRWVKDIVTTLTNTVNVITDTGEPTTGVLTGFMFHKFLESIPIQLFIFNVIRLVFFWKYKYIRALSVTYWFYFLKYKIYIITYLIWIIACIFMQNPTNFNHFRKSFITNTDAIKLQATRPNFNNLLTSTLYLIIVS